MATSNNLLSHLLFILLAMIIGMASFCSAENVFSETDQQDLEKASALAKTFFWRNLVALWDCGLVDHEKSHFEGKTKLELDAICKKWGQKGMATNAYIKYWEFKNRKLVVEEEVSHKRNKSDEEKEFECLSVKPRFTIDGQELLLSSALQPIMAVYRDLFLWGQGEGLKMEMKFANESAWDTVDRWVNTYKNAQRQNVLSDVSDIVTMLRESKRHIDMDPYLSVYRQKSSKFPIGFENLSEKEEQRDSRKWTRMKMDEDAWDERISNGTKNLIEELLSVYSPLEHQMWVPYFSDDWDLIAKADEDYQKLWNIGLEIGFDAELSRCPFVIPPLNNSQLEP